MNVINFLTICALYGFALTNLLVGKLELGFILLSAGRIIQIGAEVSAIKNLLFESHDEYVKDTDKSSSDN